MLCNIAFVMEIIGHVFRVHASVFYQTVLCPGFKFHSYTVDYGRVLGPSKNFFFQFSEIVSQFLEKVSQFLEILSQFF